MNYLIQAYACSPRQGGEYAVSWGWIKHLHKRLKQNDHIYVLSLTLKESDLIDAKLNRVSILYIKGMEKYSFLNYNIFYQIIWQKKAYKTAIRSNICFDFIHVYSLSDFRQPGKWYKFKNAITIFGPVGGGQICPKGLHEYETKSGKIREFINFLFKYDCFYKHKINRYDKVYACNIETQNLIQKAEIMIDVPLKDEFRNLDIEFKEETEQDLIILFTGRLIQKKGLFVLIDALQYIDRSLHYKLLIYGEGADKEQIERKISDSGFDDKVVIMGKVPYEKISEVYRNADIFVMPSIRESGGSVLAEAMAHKLPLVALDMSLAHFCKINKCGLFVDINKSKDEILKQFAANLSILLNDRDLRRKYGENGYRFVNDRLTWDNMIERIYKNS